MRSPERISEILELINQVWVKDPDMRFMQLLYVLQHRYSEENGGIGKIESEKNDDGSSRIGFDLFNVEDTEVIKLLKGFLNEIEP